MRESTRRWLRREDCITEVGVSEFGDPDHTFGYAYDERDGSGLDSRPALDIDRGDGRPDFRMLDLDKRAGCFSAAPVPGGTADPAKSAVRRRGATRLADLERWFARLERIEERIEHQAERFDEWESCLSWIPVTEYGDPERRFGYLFGGEEDGSGFRPALAVDRSEWDDPDYEFLAFKKGDVPFSSRECESEPGEEVDKMARTSAAAPLKRSGSRADRLSDLRQDIHSFAEDVEDLFEPVEEFDLFDQCAFVIGVSEYGINGGDEGYQFGSGRRAALAMDMRGFDRGQYDLMAFPGEEPPQIECNEDAGGQDTDE
jgi:hypothetical protein